LEVILALNGRNSEAAGDCCLAEVLKKSAMDLAAGEQQLPTAAIAAMEFDLDSVTAEAVESLLAAAAASVDDVNGDGNGGRGEQLFQQVSVPTAQYTTVVHYPPEVLPQQYHLTRLEPAQPQQPQHSDEDLVSLLSKLVEQDDEGVFEFANSTLDPTPLLQLQQEQQLQSEQQNGGRGGINDPYLFETSSVSAAAVVATAPAGTKRRTTSR
jgi:hypothetical protein